jgi:lipopolysaccharide heptosyltransferase II
LFRNLRSRKIDLSIDFHGLFKSALLVMLAGAKFRLASSSTNGMRELSWLFSKEIKPAKPEMHCVDRHFVVASYLGCQEEERCFNIEIGDDVFDKTNKILADKGLDKSKPFAAIHPGGGWLARRWPSERYSELTGRLSKELGLQIVLVGGKEGGTGELGLNEEVIRSSDAKIFDLTGLLDLKELAAVLKKCAVFVANEAGPMHIATALKAPAVAIIGPTDPDRTGPYRGNTRIIRRKVSCQPCRNRNCGTKECMELVTVDEVFEAVKEKLSI